MAMNLGGPKGIVADMNVTPMIDVLLVLIIVFMIIHTATDSTGLEALAPHPPDRSDGPAQPRTVVVEMFVNGAERPALKINREPVQWETLRGRLVEIYKLRAERVLFIKADHDILFQDVAEVMDMAHGAFPDMKIGLITS